MDTAFILREVFVAKSGVRYMRQQHIARIIARIIQPQITIPPILYRFTGNNAIPLSPSYYRLYTSTGKIIYHVAGLMLFS